MAILTKMVEGTIKPDGTLELDEKLNLLPGRVMVTIQSPDIPGDDPFWQRMQAIWDAQKARGHAPRSIEEVEEERQRMREGWDERQQELERIQQECAEARWNKEVPPEQAG